MHVSQIYCISAISYRIIIYFSVTVQYMIRMISY